MTGASCALTTIDLTLGKQEEMRIITIILNNTERHIRYYSYSVSHIRKPFMNNDRSFLSFNENSYLYHHRQQHF